MSIEAFEEYLERLEVDCEEVEGGDGLDLTLETSWGHTFVASLVVMKARYALFVSPLVVPGKSPDLPALHRRMLELNDERRHVKLSLDADGDVKVTAEGFTRLDGYGQFRRRLDALLKLVDDHGRELAELAGGTVA